MGTALRTLPILYSPQCSAMEYQTCPINQPPQEGRRPGAHSALRQASRISRPTTKLLQMDLNASRLSQELAVYAPTPGLTSRQRWLVSARRLQIMTDQNSTTE